MAQRRVHRAPSPLTPSTISSAASSSPTTSSAPSHRWSRPASKPSPSSATSLISSFATTSTPAPELFLPKKRTLEETLAFAADLLAALETCDWTHDSLDAAIRSVGTAKEWSVKENFMLLRAILTGRTSSPPLLESLIVFGKARSLDRLRRFLEAQKETLKRQAASRK